MYNKDYKHGTPCGSVPSRPVYERDRVTVIARVNVSAMQNTSRGDSQISLQLDTTTQASIFISNSEHSPNFAQFTIY